MCLKYFFIQTWIHSGTHWNKMYTIQRHQHVTSTSSVVFPSSQKVQEQTVLFNLSSCKNHYFCPAKRFPRLLKTENDHFLMFCFWHIKVHMKFDFSLALRKDLWPFPDDCLLPNEHSRLIMKQRKHTHTHKNLQKHALLQRK